jgi:hypothetical protein
MHGKTVLVIGASWPGYFIGAALMAPCGGVKRTQHAQAAAKQRRNTVAVERSQTRRYGLSSHRFSGSRACAF